MDDQPILIFGKNGQVGSALVCEFSNRPNVLAYGRDEADFLNLASIESAIDFVQPKLIINAAAYTAVDKAESEPHFADQVNGHTVGQIARIAAKRKISLIHYSTDYVFDGTKGSPYTEEDHPNPINAYGRSKLLGEQLIQEAGGSYLILRTSWVYDFIHDNFVTKVLRWAQEKDTLRIVDDQIGSPTWAGMLAEKTIQLIKMENENKNHFERFKRKSGNYHLCSDGYVSRLGWAKKIIEANPFLSTKLIPAKSGDFPTDAQRPFISALNCEKIIYSFNIQLPTWDTQLPYS